MRDTKKSTLKINTSRATNQETGSKAGGGGGGGVSKILSRVDDLEVMMADCMRIVNEILEAVKDSKIPSLARLALIAKDKLPAEKEI